jgi:hypothetical protein
MYIVLHPKEIESYFGQTLWKFYYVIFYQFTPSSNGYPLRKGRRQQILDFGIKFGELLGGDRMSVKGEMTKIYNLQVQLTNVSEWIIISVMKINAGEW